MKQQITIHLLNTFICFFKHIWFTWILLSSYTSNNPVSRCCT
nr:MAG TPA: hypothetical protein [Caudoviricetes sp.]